MNDGDRKHYSGAVIPGIDPDETREKGLTCPDCGCSHFRVIYTRPAARGRIQRRRECRHCGRRFTTMESAADVTEAK